MPVFGCSAVAGKDTEALVMQFGQFGKAGPGILLYVIISL